MLARYLAEYQHQLNSAANPIQAVGMSAYMKHQFSFIGIPTPIRRKLIKTVEVAAVQQCGEADLLQLAQALWQQPGREFHYCAIELLIRGQAKLSLAALPLLEQLICTQSWWDSVDTLASKVVGDLARREPTLIALLDQWQTSQQLWLRRTAIIYQLSWKTSTDTTRLFQACRVNAADTDFFIRKAIGWALRQYARTNAAAVLDFVEQTALSALSRREALKHYPCHPHSED
jgi:3-methyladenine DNA glycosylase AlkD